ncbi:MAG: LuxR C-terminal-related transcriptional regulator [Pseudomonadota bacterium]
MTPAGYWSLETVPSTKLHPPRLPRHVITRDELLARLMQARERRCIVLQGPGGSGKTVLAVAWRQALGALDVDVAWLSLIPQDDEPHRFWACVLASLARIDPELVRAGAQLLDRDDDTDSDELWVITLVQSMSARPRELVLVIDDVQLVTDARIGRMLHWLLDYAPPQFHLVLATRNSVPLVLQRWRAQGQLAEFDLNDLRFTAGESLRFLREQIAGIPAEEATRLHRITDGWVAGLQLLAINLKAGQGHGDAPSRMQDASAFAGYFGREVLQRLHPDDLEVLMHCAISHRFCAPLCAALLGRADVGDVARRLRDLQRADLFVSRVPGDDGEAWFRIHPLLREVLMDRLEARSGAAVQELHRIAWRWFDARGAIDEAVRHAVLAHEAEAGADLIEANAERVIARNGMAQLGVLVRLLPAETVKRRFGLRLLMAHLGLAVRNLAAVEAESREMERDIVQSSSRAAAARMRQGLTVLRAGLAMQRDDSDAILALRAELEAIPDSAPDFEVARRGQALAWMHMNRGDHGAARKALDDSEPARSSDEYRLTGDAFRGMSFAFEGRLSDAEAMLSSVLERAQRQPDIDGSVVCMAAGLLCDPLYEANALKDVRGLIEPRIELLERSVIPDILLRSMTVLSSTHWILGNRLEALSIAQRLEDHALRHQLDRALAQALLLQMRWQLREGRTDAANTLLHRIEALGQRHRDAAPGTFTHVLRVAGRARATMSLHWNDFAQARTLLREALAGAEGAGRWRDVAATRMQLVLASLGDGREQEAQAHLQAALELGHRMGLLRSLLDAGPAVPSLLREWQARQAAGGDPVLAFYVRRLLAAAGQASALARPARGAVPQPGSIRLSERESEVLALVARAMPNKKIARALDVTPHTVKFHLRNIYLKLGVSERDRALARWQELQAPATAGSASTENRSR